MPHWIRTHPCAAAIAHDGRYLGQPGEVEADRKYGSTHARRSPTLSMGSTVQLPYIFFLLMCHADTGLCYGIILVGGAEAPGKARHRPCILKHAAHWRA